MANRITNKLFAVYANSDFLRLNSSSGAIFSLLAEYIIRLKGAIYGVAMSQNCCYAEFARVDTNDDLPKLRGSKYLQARVGKTYQQVKSDLESGLTVLFSGTGCQVNGLKTFLDKEYENLYCIDVICHGVPSPKLWKKYVSYVECQQNAKLRSVNFRCKDNNWTDFGIKRIDESHKAMYVSKDKDPYMIMFLRDYCLRPSCYECIAKQDHKSDITIADFWGINNVAPEMNDNKGTSLVIIRTDKGLKLFDTISGEMVIKEVSYEDGVRSNPSEYSSVKRPKERDFFFEDLKNISFEDMIAKYGKPTVVPLKSKIKNRIKCIIFNSLARKIIGGGYKVKSQNYGLLFTFEEK